MVPYASAPPWYQLTNYTPYEIYLSFRTSPVGALAPRAAMYETVQLLGRPIAWSWAGGYATGSVVRDLMQTYTPDLYDAIGGTIDQMLQNILDALTPQQKADQQSGSAVEFGVTPQFYLLDFSISYSACSIC